MAHSVFTIAPSLAGGIDLAQLQVMPERHGTLLSRGERDVVRLLGAEALLNLREFGERCERDGTFTAAVMRHRSLFHPEVVPWLAKELADYLIAYHTMAQALDGAVQSSFFGSLPKTTGSLVAMGRSLLRYTPYELRAALGDTLPEEFGAAALLGGGERPLWGMLSFGVIQQFNLLQHRAYQARLDLQPQGDSSINRGLSDANAQYNDKFTRVITVATLSSLRNYTSQELTQLREIGFQQLGQQFVPFSLEELATRPVYHIITADGGLVEVPRGIVDTFEKIHHESWCVTRTHIEGGARDSHSIQSYQKQIGNIGRERQALFYSNLSRISVLTLPRELALLPPSS